MVASDVEGSSVGVEEAERVRCAEDAGMLERPVRIGLLSCWLFFRDLVPGEPAAGTFDELVLIVGRMGDVSREGSGEPVADVDTEVAPETWDACLGGSESVLRSDVLDDSRSGVGCAGWALPVGGCRPRAAPSAIFVVDLSMAAVLWGSGEDTRVEPRPDQTLTPPQPQRLSAG